MPGIYGPPQRAKPSRPVRPDRPEGPTIKILRWVGTFALFIAAMALYIYVEMQQGPSEAEQRLIEIQQRLNTQPYFDLNIKPIPFEPIQTADLIPNSAIRPADAPARAQESPQTPAPQASLQSATPISSPPVPPPAPVIEPLQTAELIPP